MNENGKNQRLIIPVDSVNQRTQEIVQRAGTNISETEIQYRDFFQQETQALGETLQHAVQMVQGKDFRILIEEEVTVIEE